MRADSIQFAQANESPSKEPRYVVAILFDVESIYCTSHDDIPSVPGVVMQGVLQEPSAISQRIVPDEGRSEIGSFSFSLVDLGSVFTDEIRDKLADGKGLRRKVVEFYCGFEGDDFTAFQLFQTQIVDDCDFDKGVYSVSCSDITREQRKDIFEPKFTTLRDNVSDTATTIPVYVTSAFSMVAHGSWWSDASSATVGYIKLENEIIRYTGKTADTFTGCTRGALNTKAVAHNVDAATAADRRTKVEEYIYLELPAVMMALAINTGELYGTANVLPSHWHLGVDTDFIREADFTGIGTDLWNPSDNANSLILRFEGLKKTDGKRFLEKEIYLLLGCFSPIYSDGTIGLRKLPALISDTAPVVTLTKREIISTTALKHDLSGMHNNFRVNWNWDPAKEQFTRISQFIDTESIAIHGTSTLKEYSFKGLHGSRHTDAIVLQRLHSLRDAYAHPPQRISVTCFGSLSKYEVGDVVRLNAEHIRDFAGSDVHIDRSFLILNKSHQAARNAVTFELFGSTARPLATTPGSGVTAPLPDGFYNATGTALNTVITITGGTMATGSHTLTGNASLTNSGAIYYFLGDLTIPSGTNLTISANVQLRIRGHLTLNGTISGTGNGLSGVADAGTTPWDLQIAGNPGFVGHSRGYDGIKIGPAPRPTVLFDCRTIQPVLTRGSYDAFPFLQLTVSGTSLIGLPADLSGTGGPPGGRIVANNDNISAVGGTGASGGAGLAIICRGMSLGASASITLNGANAVQTTLLSAGVQSFYAGNGGNGGPGSLLILLDGNAISVPDITGKFFAFTGSSTQLGNPMPERTAILGAAGAPNLPNPPHTGYLDSAVINGQDWSNAAHRIQYVPESQTVAPDVEEGVPPPTSLAVDPLGGGNMVRWTRPAAAHTAVEVYASLDNNRANAVKVGEAFADSYFHSIPLGGLRYYWARTRRTRETVDYFSTWEPTGATSGIACTASPLDRSAIERIAPDAEMSLSTTKGEFWDWLDSGTQSVITLHSTGGLVGGVMRITNSSGRAGGRLIPRRQGGRLQVANGDSVQVTIRWRRTEDYNNADEVFHIAAHTVETDGGAFTPLGDTAFGETIDIRVMDSDLDEWVEQTYTLSTDVLPGEYVSTIQPFLDFRLTPPSVTNVGEIEIDLLRVELAPNKFKALSAGLVPKPTAATVGTGVLKDDATFVDIPWLKDTPAEVAAGITPVNYAYAPVPFYDARRVGLVDDGGVSDQTDKLVAAYAAAKGAFLPLLLPPGTFRFTSTLVWDGYVDVYGSGKQKTILQKDGDFSGVDLGGNGRAAHIQDLTVAEVSTGTTGSGIFISSDEAHVAIINVAITDHGGIGLYLVNDGSGAGVNGEYRGLALLRNGSDGLRVDGHYKCYFENINSFDNTGWGAQFMGGGSYHEGSLTCQNNTAGGTKIDTQQNTLIIYGEANTGPDLELTGDSFNNLIQLQHDDGAGKFIDEGSNNLIISTTSNATAGFQSAVYNRRTRWTNDEGFSVLYTAGHAGTGATGKKGGDVELVGGNAAGSSGLVHGGLCVLRGGTGINGGRDGTVRIQLGDGPVTIGPILGPTNESVSLEFGSTARVPLLPKLTSTQRDALTAVDGMILYNTTTSKAQVRAGGAWVDLH